MAHPSHAPSTGGVEVAVHRWDGEGPPLLLVHANGFCAGALRPLGEALAAAFRPWAVDLRGHGSTRTPDDADFTWYPSLSDDLLAAVDALGLAGGYAFGHSVGGAALLDAAARRPDAFRAMYCYEPIVWPEPLPPGSCAHLVERARRRRHSFASRDEARAHYAARPPFAAFAPAALDGFLDCALEEAGEEAGNGEGEGEGVRLRCRREWEAALFARGVAHDGMSRLPAVTCPVTIAVGDGPGEVTAEMVALQAAALPRGRARHLAGLSHLGPMEDPRRVADEVRACLLGGG